MIRILDYGMGNIQAFLNLFNRLGVDARRAQTSDALLDATKIILPGVGHYDHAMHLLNNSGMRPKLEALVLGSKVPVMGICVGMQMLAQGSEEGMLPGLNWVPGRVRAFSNHPLSANLPLPHMGWNDMRVRRDSSIFAKNSEDDSQFYFLHSYFFDAEDKRDVVSTANYGLDFDAVVSRGHIYGVQFHPEKSHHWGEQLLRNFVEL